MNVKFLSIIAAVCVMLIAIVMGFGNAGDTEAMDQTVTAQTSLEDLSAITPVVGAPVVSWARLPMGKIVSGRDVPGPTDLILTAILDYGSQDAATAALGGAGGAPTVLDFSAEPVRYSWWPATLSETLEGGKLAAEEYLGVAGFGDAAILRTDAAPQFLILRKPLF